jgi:hypothetical protein
MSITDEELKILKMKAVDAKRLAYCMCDIPLQQISVVHPRLFYQSTWMLVLRVFLAWIDYIRQYRASTHLSRQKALNFDYFVLFISLLSLIAFQRL